MNRWDTRLVQVIHIKAVFRRGRCKVELLQLQNRRQQVVIPRDLGGCLIATLRLLNISMPLCQRMALPVPYTFLPSRNWRMENGSLKSFEASNGHTEKVKMLRGTRTCSHMWNLPYGLGLKTAQTFEHLWLNLVSTDYLQEIRLQLDVGSSPSPVWRANRRISGSATETKHFATRHAVSMVGGWILVLPEIMRTSHTLTFIPLRRETWQFLTSKQNMVMSVMSSNLLFKSFRIGGFGDFTSEPRIFLGILPRDHFIRTRSDQVRDGCWRCTPQWVLSAFGAKKKTWWINSTNVFIDFECCSMF